MLRSRPKPARTILEIVAATLILKISCLHLETNLSKWNLSLPVFVIETQGLCRRLLLLCVCYLAKQLEIGLE